MRWRLDRHGFEVVPSIFPQRLAFDFLPGRQDELVSAEVDIDRGDLVGRFVVTAVVQVVDEMGDLALELPR